MDTIYLIKVDHYLVYSQQHGTVQHGLSVSNIIQSLHNYNIYHINNWLSVNKTFHKVDTCWLCEKCRKHRKNHSENKIFFIQ